MSSHVEPTGSTRTWLDKPAMPPKESLLTMHQAEGGRMVEDEENVVTVFGSGDVRDGGAAYATALATGGALARLGYTVANGGYGGAMEASARGARAAGGRAIGVLCSLWKSPPNAYLDRTITTGDVYARARTLIELGRGGYVVLPGATGTLVEIALVWELMCKGFLPERPVVCVGAFWQPVIDMMSRARPGCGRLVAAVAAPDRLADHFAPV